MTYSKGVFFNVLLGISLLNFEIIFNIQCSKAFVNNYTYQTGPPLKMLLKPVWVGKIHVVGVYATHSVRIW